jgi:hypothetical protein
LKVVTPASYSFFISQPVGVLELRDRQVPAVVDGASCLPTSASHASWAWVIVIPLDWMAKSMMVVVPPEGGGDRAGLEVVGRHVPPNGSSMCTCGIDPAVHDQPLDARSCGSAITADSCRWAETVSPSNTLVGDVVRRSR